MNILLLISWQSLGTWKPGPGDCGTAITSAFILGGTTATPGSNPSQVLKI